MQPGKEAACPLLIVKANICQSLGWEVSSVLVEWLLIDSWIDYLRCWGTLLLSWDQEEVDDGVSGFHPVWAAAGKGGGRRDRQDDRGHWLQRVSSFSLISRVKGDRIQFGRQETGKYQNTTHKCYFWPAITCFWLCQGGIMSDMNISALVFPASWRLWRWGLLDLLEDPRWHRPWRTEEPLLLLR